MSLRSIVRLTLVLLVVGVHLSSPVLTTPAQTESRKQARLAKSSVLKKSLAAIVSSQDPNGGFAHSRGSIDPRATAEVIIMMIALRNEGIEVNLDAALAYLQQTDPVKWAEAEFVTVTGGEIARIVMALAVAGGDPRSVGGNDLVAALTATWDSQTGFYGPILYDSPLVVMALTVAGAPVEEKAIETFLSTQLDDGAWDPYGGEGTGDGWVTAFVVQSLVATGRGDDPAIASAVGFLRTLQGPNGDFASSPGGEPDSYTTGIVLSALIAAGEDLKAPEWSNAIAALIANQKENGWFQRSSFDPYDDLTSTVAAIVALAGAYWPVVPIE